MYTPLSQDLTATIQLKHISTSHMTLIKQKALRNMINHIGVPETFS